MKVSDTTNVQMPLKTVVSLITLVAVGTWAYFGVIERLNNIEWIEQIEKWKEILKDWKIEKLKIWGNYWKIEKLKNWKIFN